LTKNYFYDSFFSHLNTLFRIAAMENATKTQQYILKISELIRYKTTREEQLLPVKDEMRAVENFIDIFKMRFEDCFNITFDIAPEALNYYIPHYTLMTFVENALYHGLEMREDTKTLIINAGKTEMGLSFEIIDNGRGFDPDRYLKASDSTAPYGSISSTVERLSSYYHHPQIVTIVSSNKGTSVFITIPL
jgi:two-component system, sensor histidine kinase YesM